MRNMVKRTAAGAVLGGSLLVTGGLAIANAAPGTPGTDVNDQLVNLAIGNGNVLRDLNVDTASQIAGLLCGTGTGVNGPAANAMNPNAPNATQPNAMNQNSPNATGMAQNESNANVGEITAQARQVDAGTMPTTTCDSAQGVVTISQNTPANTPNASETPGQPRGATGATPSTSPAPAPAPAGQLNPAPNS